MKKEIKKTNTYDLMLIAAFSALIAVCAWITVPSVVPFTLQTFGIFTVLGILGGRRATLSVLVYILLGTVGVPVFSGFKGGIGAILGPTGGYIIGFLCGALVYWLITLKRDDKPIIVIIGFICSLAVCYAFGTVWFVEVYSRNVQAIGYASALSTCVLPFIIPDAVKMILAFALVRILKPFLIKHGFRAH